MNKMMKKIGIKKADLILITCILLIALTLLGVELLRKDQPNTGTYASIRIDNKLYKEVELTDEPQIIKIQTKRGYDILKVHDRGIEVIESDCPQKICFSFGLISRPRQSIICLPLRMIVEVKPNSTDDIDAIL